MTSEHLSSYHGQPVLKQPVWSWEIPCYFYAGGLAGASAGLAYLSELRGNEVLARRAWAAALLGIGVSPALLTSDLGRPARFLNMLRMVKVTSPMSIGSWILSASGATTALATVSVWTGWFPRAGRAARPAAAALGLPLSTYTAALIANTAVPVWHEARVMLPFVFGSGAALSAGAAGVIATPPKHARSSTPACTGRRGARSRSQPGDDEAARRARRALPPRRGVALRPDRRGHDRRRGGACWRAVAGGTAQAAIAAGVLLSAGALSIRWSVFKAGFQSAADPKYVVGPQRARDRPGRAPWRRPA